MRIYTMTATFGKLEHQTLVLEPGLNIIEAPNEWGKSTWCAFLVAMLYGLDTRQKTTKTALADKEKYAPWSGAPMAGRIDLRWNGKDITIERSSKGRTPMGIFRAYETRSGLAVPELTASNCGQLLLGVEQSVFRRTGFIRQSDMPVTQDDALRRRLNELVTTGDESGDSDRLEEELKELRNKCRYNRSGLLPQAEAQRKELEDKLAELDSMEQQCRSLKERRGEAKAWLRALENHRDALCYAAAMADAGRVARAKEVRDQAEEKLMRLEQICSGQPSREEVERKITAIQVYRDEVSAYQEESAKRLTPPEPPVPPERFRDMSFEQAETMVRRDLEAYEQLKRRKRYRIFLIIGWILLIFSVLAVLMKDFIIAGAAGVLGLLFLIMGAQRKQEQRRNAKQLEEKYGSPYPEAWMMQLQRYEAEKAAYDQALLDYRIAEGDLDIRRTFLQKQRESLFGTQNPEKVLEIWKRMSDQWQQYETARREYQQSEQHWKTLREMATPLATPPAMEDTLAYSPSETQRLLTDTAVRLSHLENRLSQYQGRMEAIGDAAALHAQLQTVDQRIGKLEQVYRAVTLALETLTRARQELQRKFAPRIAARAQELMSRLTAGRYDRLTLQEDLSLLAAARQQDTLRALPWYSDGTMDQLYLALRLAVAEEVTPEAPLVLDDAFVRFDDSRLEAALEILQEEASSKQVILFTCQSREKDLLN
ncbi:MAG: AAA family ATPase [Oscillospiraceae bacterium]|nr:AAA family ATPase [Oscillospiraceae bacterium]